MRTVGVGIANTNNPLFLFSMGQGDGQTVYEEWQAKKCCISRNECVLPGLFMRHEYSKRVERNPFFHTLLPSPHFEMSAIKRGRRWNKRIFLLFFFLLFLSCHSTLSTISWEPDMLVHLLAISFSLPLKTRTQPLNPLPFCLAGKMSSLGGDLFREEENPRHPTEGESCIVLAALSSDYRCSHLAVCLKTRTLRSPFRREKGRV